MAATVIETRSGAWTPGLTPAESATLMRIAWDSLRWHVRGRVGIFDWTPYTVTPALRMPYATFVTLHRLGKLRGCIGALEAGPPLFQSVHDNALKAAGRDPRFAPLVTNELDGLDARVSILSAPETIPSLAAFRVGEHGIILEHGAARAVFLPEVAPEQGWTREDTARHLCLKAGLPPDAWRAGAVFKVFYSVVVSEDEP